MTAHRRAAALRPRKQPRQARSRETVRAILRAGAQVFASRGYAASTTNHIAERAGVSIGSLYEYFPNKDAVLVALLEEHISEAEVILAGVAVTGLGAGGLAAIVRRFVQAMVRLHARDRALHRVLFEEAPLTPAVRRRLAAVEEQVTEHVAAFLRLHPDVARPDPALAAAVVVQAIEGLTHRLVIHAPADAAVEPQIDEIVDLVTAYLGTPARAPASA